MPKITSFTPENYHKGNIGWLFTKAYYERINFDYLLPDTIDPKKIKAENAKKYKVRTKSLVNKQWVNYNQMAEMLVNNSQLLPNNPENTFELTVDNPGLLYGTGITHESGHDEELKIGFLFDYATGLIIIPGHTIKGVLKFWFKQPRFLDYLMNENDLHDIRTIDGESLTLKTIRMLIQEMFEGDELSIYNRDIFHEAVLVDSKHSHNLFLGLDAITPHGSNALKNPIPLPFIKLLPNSILKFNFDFKDGVVHKKHKLEIVKRLIKDFGIGAKTNVGYGQFI